jgi:hypothetical protein
MLVIKVGRYKIYICIHKLRIVYVDGAYIGSSGEKKYIWSEGGEGIGS